MANSRIKGITIEIGGDTTKLERALKGADKASRDLNLQLKDINRSLKFNPGNAELIAQKQRVLGESIKNTSAELKLLKQAQREASEQLKRGEIGKDRYDALVREILRAEKQLKSYTNQSKELVRVSKEQSTGLDGLRRSVGDIGDSTKKSAEEFERLNMALKLDPKNVEVISQKQEFLRENIKKSVDEIKRLNEKQESLNELLSSGKLSKSEYQDLTVDIQRAKKELQDFQNVMKGQSGLNKLGDDMQDFGKKSADLGKRLAPVSAVSAGMLVGATKQAMDFESSMAGVRKTVDLSDDEFKKMAEDIQAMSERLPAGANEIAGVVESAGQLGIQKENLLSFAKAMIDLGEATNLSSEEGASQLAQFANITRMSQGDFDRLGSTIVGLGNNFATTEADIVAMGMRLAGTGSQIGLTQAEIMGLATSMSSVGIEAEAGGSAMSAVMNKINNAVALGGDALNDFSKVAGVSSAEFANVWKNKPAEAIAMFVDGLKRIDDSGANVNLALRELNISGIRETDMLNRLTGASGILNEAFTMSNELFSENTALTNEAEQRYATTESKVAMLKNSFVGMGVEVGEKLLPMMVVFVDALKQLLQGFNNLPDGVQGFIGIFLILVSAISPLLIVIGQMSIGLGALLKLFPAVGGVAAKLAPVFSGISLSTVALVVAVVAVGVLVGKVIYEIVTHFEELKEGVIVRFQLIEARINEFKANVGLFFTNIKNAIFGFVSSVVGKCQEFRNKTVEVLTGAFNSIKEIYDEFKKAISERAKNTVENIKRPFKEGLENLKNIVKNALDSILGFFRNIKLPEIKIPKIKIPHFTIKGGFSISPPSVPKFGISWYKNGGIFTKPTVFNTPYGFKGVGEAGAEAVLPLDRLRDIIRDVMGEGAGQGDITLNVNLNNANIRSEEDVQNMARLVYDLFSREMSKRKRGRGLSVV